MAGDDRGRLWCGRWWYARIIDSALGNRCVYWVVAGTRQFAEVQEVAEGKLLAPELQHDVELVVEKFGTGEKLWRLNARKGV